MPKISEPVLLLLDTHVWLWLVFGTRDLSTRKRRVITDAAKSRRLRISAITFWEIALLASGNRVNLRKPTAQWLNEAILGSGVLIEPLDANIAAAAYDLPDTFHRDPADRVIVASARLTGAAVMTRDRRILAYAAQGHVAAVPA